MSNASSVDGAIRAALVRGGRQLSALLTEWNTAPWCSSPVARSMSYRQERRHGGPRPGRELVAWVACRKCEPCLRHRQHVWFSRICAEMNSATASFLTTLTLGPGDREAIDLKRSLSGIHTSPDDPFPDRARLMVPLIQRYIKRSRKGQPKLRYLFVVEPHQDRWCHAHILWHLQRPLSEYTLSADGSPLFLREKWVHGFTAMRRTAEGTERAAGYVAKYLVKEPGLCLRASQHYGAGEAPGDGDIALASASPLSPLRPTQPASEGL